jgi:hypothetical protein
VGRIVFDDESKMDKRAQLKAIGIELFEKTSSGSSRSVGIIRCKKEVIVSAGAIGSPQLL